MAEKTREDDAPSQADTSLVSASLASASSLVLLQLLSRVFTFVLNQALVRLVTPQVFGTASIQFELLLSTILFLSREGVRNALLRSTENKARPQQSALIYNISLLPVLLGAPVAVASVCIYLFSSSATTASQPHFHFSAVIYALAAFCELLSEPLYIRAQNELRFDVRVRTEGSAVLMKTLVTFLALVSLSPDWALVAFAAGQAAYGLTMLVGFLGAYGFRARYWPEQVVAKVHDNTKTEYFDTKLLHLSMAMTGQSVIKHFLTEGDKFLVSRLSPLADQGGYAVASNYGSLVARIVFQPIEETSRLFFSKTLSSTTSNKWEDLQVAANVLTVLLLLFTHLFLLLVTFAPPYLSFALRLVLPARYLQTSAPAILRTYVYYIPTMAFNGILEAFFTSTATPADLRAQSRWLLGFSACFVGTAALLARGGGLGDTSLVWANAANLCMRAFYAWMFAARFFCEQGAGRLVHWRKAVPPVKVLVLFALAAAATRWSEATLGNKPLTLGAQIPHVFVGAACALACLAACVLWERKTFQDAYSLLRKR
ncbi:oligosaccharide translocation protein RFT1 [Phanerochaete sordida]|uniref:Man(5)GlcNAc(2)-PP-dolichol translocation protein RFT1 n=1 Tax=Phanerochaete sordida TaxID=48140 RepID=A0A9P3LL34_9APHY|nr:oligosaccharide translocation protein RFT1 [Phanerochaete sordida]